MMIKTTISNTLPEITAFSQMIRFSGRTYYDSNSHMFNHIRLPSVATCLFPHLQYFKSMFVIRTFLNMELTVEYLMELKSPPIILQLFEATGSINSRENNNRSTVNLLKSRCFKYGNEVIYGGTTYLDNKTKLFNVIRLPAGMLKTFPDLKNRRAYFELHFFPTINQLLGYILSLEVPPLILHFFCIPDNTSNYQEIFKESLSLNEK